MSSEINQQWLRELLDNLGDTHAAVAQTLRDAGIRGVRGDTHDCPIARYVLSRVRECVPAEPVTVVVAGGVTVEIGTPGKPGHETISAWLPEPVAAFVGHFDDATDDLYADLVDPSTA
jgi:hypothetical protein